MNSELISKKTRLAFREFLVGWTLREIGLEFEAAEIPYDRQYEPPESGQRRAFVEQHYHSLDFTKKADVRRLLAAYENILSKAVRKLDELPDRKAGERVFEELVACLRRDGFDYVERRIVAEDRKMKSLFEVETTFTGISEVTRRNILDTMRLEKISWAGRLEETEFLGRLYDLKALCSRDPRFKSAESDIWQHRVNNPEDWPDDWVFSDSRFNLMGAPDEDFLSFLCEMVHPVVRPDDDEVKKLVGLFNSYLAVDGWEIVPETVLSGKPVYGNRRHSILGHHALGHAEQLASSVNADYVNRQLVRMREAVEEDPELAIGTAKELVETICKTILREAGQPISSKVDLPQLVKQARQELDLLPESIPEKAKGAEIIKKLLSNLGTVAQGLAELRQLYGSGHGKDAKTTGLKPRHARLAVGAAGAMALFLFETYQEKKQK